MISSVTKQQIDSLKPEEYWPAQDVRKILHDKSFVMLIGPAAIGKSTLMSEVARLDKDFARVKNMTTRPRRFNDEVGLYDYIPHTDIGLRVLLDQIRRKELVQFAVHPTTGFIYGTFPQNYPATYNMLDTQSQVVSTLSKLPFHKTHKVGLVTDPDTWKIWFEKRHEKEPDEYIKRIEEAIRSLEWLTAQPAKTIQWVYNHPDNLEASARELITAIKTGSDHNIAHRDYAVSMLSLAYQMKG